VEGQPAPSMNDEVLIYQTMLGAWPLQKDEVPIFRERLQQYMVKAVREAKEHTSWIRPRLDYESALASFTESILASPESGRFLKEFASFQKTVSHCGALNSLSQLLLKVGSPGVPDFYQGSELWDFSLADPDNRRPVDFQTRLRLIEDLRRIGSGQLRRLARELLERWQDGTIKLFVTYKALNFRQSNTHLFQDGEYIPLEVTGSRRNHVCAFARRKGKAWAIIAVPRLLSRLVDPDGVPVGSRMWGRGMIVLPSQAPPRWRGVFTDRTLKVKEEYGRKMLPLSQIFQDFPVALLAQAKIPPATP
jgi:(1->4)-alpha-D-glucan 1-alpha-D-glucosylmutase